MAATSSSSAMRPVAMGTFRIFVQARSLAEAGARFNPPP
jgi:hypothetical protein